MIHFEVDLRYTSVYVCFLFLKMKIKERTQVETGTAGGNWMVQSGTWNFLGILPFKGGVSGFLWSNEAEEGVTLKPSGTSRWFI